MDQQNPVAYKENHSFSLLLSGKNYFTWEKKKKKHTNAAYVLSISLISGVIRVFDSLFSQNSIFCSYPSPAEIDSIYEEQDYKREKTLTEVFSVTVY